MLNRINRDFKQLLGLTTTAQNANSRSNEDTADINKALLSEFYRTALSVVTMTSLCNALARGKRVQLFGTISVYMPSDPTLYTAVTKQLLFANVQIDLLNELKHFHREVHLAAAHTNVAAMRIKPERLTVAVEWKGLGWDWQAACGATRAVTDTLLTDNSLDPVFRNRVEFLADTAKDAQDGGTPSVSSDGAVIVPGVLDRRATERIRIGLPVWLESNAGRQRVTLQDISEGGMGLAFSRGLKVGMPAVAQLACGRRLQGFVVWVHDDRAGLRFATPLAGSDPLLVPRSSYL